MINLQNILNKFKKEGLFKDSFYMIFSNIYSKGMAYLFYFIVALILGAEGFGILRGLLPILDVLVIFFCSGIPPSIAKHISEQKNINYLWTIDILKIMILMAIFSFPIVFILKYILGGGYLNIDNTIYLTLGFTLICAPIIAWSRGILQGTLKIKQLSLTWVIEYTVKIISLVILVLLFGVAGAFISIGLGYLFGGLIGCYFIKTNENNKNNKDNENNKNNINWSRLLNIKNILNLFKINKNNNKNNNNIEIIKKVILYGIPIALGTASYRLLNDLDSIVIMSLLGPIDNGIYGYASLLSRVVFLFASSISIPLIPRIAKSKDISYLKKGLLLNLIIISPVLLITIIFSDSLLSFFFGINNIDSSNSLKILSISAGFMSSYTICSSSLQGLGKAKIPLYILFLGIILNLLLNYMLIPIMGIVGGAYATLISSLSIFLIIIFYSLYRYSKN